jgi:transposase
VSDDPLAKLRILNGRDVDLAEDANRASNRCRDALLSISPTLERVLGSQLAFGGVRDLLTACPTPSALARLSDDGIGQLLHERSPRVAGRLTVAIGKALAAQSVTLPDEETWGEIIVGLIADLERIFEQRRQLAEQIEEVFLSHPLGKVLVTLCGSCAGPGPEPLAEIGDPTRFKDGGRLAAYAGLAPVDRRRVVDALTGSASRRGNHRLKNAMFLAAFVATQHDPNAKAYYERKRVEGKGHNAAVICVTRRRCDLILAMLTTGQAYDPNHSEYLAKAA